tara:strand:+ start:32 stop:562 length:531 start_codon:yes stop_codon:yes gene_type:complete
MGGRISLDYKGSKPETRDCEHEDVSWDACVEYSDGNRVTVDITGCCETCDADIHELHEVDIIGPWNNEDVICLECECAPDYCDCYVCNICGLTDCDDEYCANCCCNHCDEMYEGLACKDCGELYGCGDCISEGDWKDSAIVCEECSETRDMSKEDKNQLAKARTLEAMAAKIREEL